MLLRSRLRYTTGPHTVWLEENLGAPWPLPDACFTPKRETPPPSNDNVAHQDPLRCMNRL